MYYCNFLKSAGATKGVVPVPRPELYLRDGMSLHTACPKPWLIKKGIQKLVSACIFWGIVAMGTAENTISQHGNKHTAKEAEQG